MKKISKSFYFAVILIFLSLKHSESQQLTNLDNNNEPIEIFADNGIEWHKNKNKYVALGNAKALSGTLSLESDKIEAFYKENDSSSMNITEVRAKKNVVVQDKKMKITGGEYAEYKILKDYFQLNSMNEHLQNYLKQYCRIYFSCFYFFLTH